MRHHQAVSTLLATRVFDIAGQKRFAKLSGDVNPLHVDPVTARREMFGDVVVHGMHGALYALEAFAVHCRGHGISGLRVDGVDAQFRDAIHLDRPVTAELIEDVDGRARLRLSSEGRRATDLSVTWRMAEQPHHTDLPVAADRDLVEPVLVAFAELSDLSGGVPVFVDGDLLGDMFPTLSTMVSKRALADLLALTRLVGMHCPGLRSIFSGFSVELRDAVASPLLAWQVSATDARVSLVKLALASPTLSGEIEAFRRPDPQVQPSYARVCEHVDRLAFSRQSALVVGGSRGLGEVTAKIIAAGGGRVVITHHRGRDDAEMVAKEIVDGGGQCTVMHLDVTDARAAELPDAPTHLYYFATPKIFVKKRGPFDEALCRHFADFYVDGFDATVRACRRAGSEQLVAFYPSSMAVDQPPRNLEEYAAAKTAGEALCADLAAADGRLTVVVKRLPRIRTDQTTTLVNVPARDALETMLPVLLTVRK